MIRGCAVRIWGIRFGGMSLTKELSGGRLRRRARPSGPPLNVLRMSNG